MSAATVAPPSTAVSVVLADVIKERWLAALRAYQPGLPQPVAVAMVEGAAKGNLGIELRKIEEALMSFEGTGLEDLTGSEARVLIAILRQMSGELTQLEGKLNSLWEQK
jgi:predicted metal-dependent TIM-barrel fold hydrolase